MELIHVDVSSLSSDGIEFGCSCFKYNYSLLFIRMIVLFLSYLDATELAKAIRSRGSYLTTDNE